MEEDAPPGAPTWLKALIIAGIAIAVVLAIVLLTTSGHGPSRHA